MDLITAIINNKKNTVFSLLSNGADILLCEDSDNITPLHHAVSSSKIEIIFMLIEFGADPHKKCSGSMQSAFELACSLCRYDVISLFSNFSASKLFH